MENSIQLFNEILGKLQETLNEYKCKSEIKLSDKEAILYGKLASYMEKFTVVIHIKEQHYIPVAKSSGKIDFKHEDTQKFIMPTLEPRILKSQKSNCSQEEQTAIKNKFIAEANVIGRDFLNRMNK
jgi:hypothetical protein